MIRGSRLRPLSRVSLRSGISSKKEGLYFKDRSGFRETEKIQNLLDHETNEEGNARKRVKQSNREMITSREEFLMVQRINSSRNRGEVLSLWRLNTKSQVIVSASIMRLAKIRSFKEAVDLFWRFKEDVEPNHVVYGAVLTACNRGSLLEKGVFIHDAFKKSGLEMNPVILLSLIRLYMRKDALLGVNLYEGYPELTKPIATIGVSLYKQANMDKKAIWLYEHLRDNTSVEFTPIKLAPVFVSLGRLGEFAEAKKFWQGLVDPPEFLYCAYANTLGLSGDTAEFEKLKKEMLDKGMKLENKFWVCWWDCLVNAGDMEVADREFAKGVRDKLIDLEHWTTSRNYINGVQERVDFHELSVGGATLAMRFILKKLSWEWQKGWTDFANFPLVFNMGVGNVMERLKEELRQLNLEFSLVLTKKGVPVALSIAPDVLKKFLIRTCNGEDAVNGSPES